MSPGPRGTCEEYLSLLARCKAPCQGFNAHAVSSSGRGAKPARPQRGIRCGGSEAAAYAGRAASLSRGRVAIAIRYPYNCRSGQACRRRSTPLSGRSRASCHRVGACRSSKGLVRGSLSNDRAGLPHCRRMACARPVQRQLGRTKRAHQLKAIFVGKRSSSPKFTGRPWRPRSSRLL